MKNIFIIMIAIVTTPLSSTADNTNSWTYSTIQNAADLIVIATSEQNRDTGEMEELKNVIYFENKTDNQERKEHRPQLKIVETTFKILSVLKGKTASNSISIKHPVTIPQDVYRHYLGQNLIDFQLKGSGPYILYIKSSPNHSYHFVSNNQNQALSVLALSGGPNTDQERIRPYFLFKFEKNSGYSFNNGLIKECNIGFITDPVSINNFQLRTEIREPKSAVDLKDVTFTTKIKNYSDLEEARKKAIEGTIYVENFSTSDAEANNYSIITGEKYTSSEIPLKFSGKDNVYNNATATESLIEFIDLNCGNINPNAVAAPDDLKPMNVHQMQLVSYFTEKHDPTDNILQKEENHSKNIGNIDFGVGGHVTLIAKPEEIAPYINPADKKKYLGHKLYLVNQEHKAVSFPTSYSQLALTLIAKNRDGEWRPVEYSERHSDVADSAYKVSLPTNHYWEFIAPKYEGTFKTKLRYVVGGRRRVYSNEFEGSINPDQFDTLRSAYLKSQIVTINK